MHNFSKPYRDLVESLRLFGDWNPITVRQTLLNEGATYEKLLHDALLGKVSTRLFPGCLCPFCKTGIVKVYSTRPLQQSLIRYTRCELCRKTDKVVALLSRDE